ncbi:MAG TPA: outer membrane beta-barrel protein [Burkholderiales bacterium]|nr:outer membrane beta-barrel protein [Burkholderiales bacterium]
MKIARSAITFLALAAGTSVATPAAAQDLHRFFAGASIGQTTASDGCSGIIVPGVTCNDSDTAWRILGGYQIDRNFAVELGYHDFGKVKATGFGVNGEVTANVWELVAVGTLPLRNRFSVYGKLGGYRGDTKLRSNAGFSGSDTNTDITFGVGGRYEFSQQIAFRAEYQAYQSVGGSTVGSSDFDVVSVGALFKF